MRETLRKYLLSFWLLGCAILLMGCPSNNTPNSTADNSGSSNASGATDPVAFRVIAGSENKTLQPLLDRFAQEHNLNIKVDYAGSVDIMLLLQSGAADYDAVWPANSLWITLGDQQKLVKNEQSILWSPVVLGVKKSVAQKLGWVGKKDVRVQDILAAAESSKLRFMMTSATQSNSGASAYLGFLYAFSGKPDVLTSQSLADPQLRGKIKRLLGTVDRSSGSSGWLKDLFLQKYDTYDAMFNYESVAIEANQALAAQGKEPLYAVYPSDGLAIADSPFGYVDHKDAAKEKIFQQMQTYLLSAPIQQEIQKQGRRVGPVGEELKTADAAVFNPEWGINVNRFLNQIRYPKADVIREALDLYQSAFRKPSYTVYCLDFSGSMEGEREKGLKEAMQMILDQTRAKQSLLQAAPGDHTTVLIFSSGIIKEMSVDGSDPQKLNQLWAEIDAMHPEGGTDIYTPIMRGLDLMKQKGDALTGYFPAIILLTDGESNTGASFSDLQAHLQTLGLKQDVPVFAIQFGESDEGQLKQLSESMSGRVFDGKADLTKAFREVKGYN